MFQDSGNFSAGGARDAEPNRGQNSDIVPGYFNCAAAYDGRQHGSPAFQISGSDAIVVPYPAVALDPATGPEMWRSGAERIATASAPTPDTACRGRGRVVRRDAERPETPAPVSLLHLKVSDGGTSVLSTGTCAAVQWMMQPASGLFSLLAIEFRPG